MVNLFSYLLIAFLLVLTSPIAGLAQDFADEKEPIGSAVFKKDLANSMFEDNQVGSALSEKSKRGSSNTGDAGKIMREAFQERMKGAMENRGNGYGGGFGFGGPSGDDSSGMDSF